jgi:hypothetical protein
MTRRPPEISEDLLRAAYGWIDEPSAPPRPARPRPTPAPPAKRKPELWTAEKRQAFKLLAPSALFVAAPDVIMWLRTQAVGGGEVTDFGGNRGFRPVRIGSMRSWRDTVTRLHDVIPHVRYGKPRRLWFRREDDRAKVARAAVELVERAADEGAYEVKLGHGLLNLGPDVDVDQLIRDLHQVARRLEVLAWDNEALSLFLDRALVAARQKGIGIVDQRGRAIYHPGFANLMDRMVERDWRKAFGVQSATR